MSELMKTLVKWRHELHKHPETAFEEIETSKFIAEKLKEMGIEVHSGIGKTGVVGVLKSGEGGKTVGFRADIDAINLKERGHCEYKSVNEGKMHGCGHDGHITTLLGAAKILSETKDFNGTVIFVFQPAEEPGKGARAMMEDGLLERFPMDEIYAMHNNPLLKEDTLSTNKGGFASAEDNFRIEIHGKGGHASAPEATKDPLVIASEIIMALQTISSRNFGAFDPVVISCTEIFTDGAHNAIPSNVTVLGDCRSYTREAQILIENRMKAIVKGICEANEAGYEFYYTHEFAPTINWDKQVDSVVKAAIKMLGDNNVNDKGAPFAASEDFGAFLEKIPGALFFLGTKTGDSTKDFPLHNSEFDYNDNVLVTGAKVFAQIARDRLA